MTSKRDPDPPPWPIYAAGRDEVIALVGELDATTVGRSVPLTPDWSIADVLAHLCGLNADVASGMRTGLGTPERTRLQVATRAGRPVDAVCEEWLSHADAVREAMDDDPGFGHRLTADLTVHRHDLQHALDVPTQRDDLATRCGAHTYGRVATDLLLDRSDIALRVELTDGTSFQPSAVQRTEITLRATPFDWLRTATGRRSSRETLALDWSDDATDLLEHLCPYGPMRATDSGF